MSAIYSRLQRSPWWVLPLLLWSIMAIAVMVRVSLSSPKRGSVYPVFATAGQAFAEGKPLYVTTEGAYRYAPVWAAFFSVGNLVPPQLASIIWRLLNLAVFVWGAIAFQSHFLSWWSPRFKQLWWCLMLPFCLGSFNNAQANLLLLGLILGAVVVFTQGRWWLVGLLLALAISLKIYPIALAMLLLLLKPVRLIPALLVSLGLLAALPFALQDHGYVVEQYHSWFYSTTADTRIDRDISDTNRDAWLLIRITGLPVPYPAYQGLQLLAGAVLALWTWLHRHRLFSPHAATYWIQFTSYIITWMLIFGPASESSTYALLAPTLALAITMIFCCSQQFVFICLSTLSFLLMILAHWGSAVPQGTVPHNYGIHPIAALLLSVAIPLIRWPSPNPQGQPSLPSTS